MRGSRAHKPSPLGLKVLYNLHHKRDWTIYGRLAANSSLLVQGALRVHRQSP